MQTKKCKECLTDIPKKAKRCPNCKADQRTWINRHPLMVIGLLFIIFIVISVAVSSNDPKVVEQIATNNQNVATQNIPYEVVESWSIPNGGYGKVIVISPNNVNRADIVTLGEQLKRDMAADRNSFIDILSDKKAASLRAKVLGQKASDEETKLYTSHNVAGYSKNANTGFHQLVIHLTGTDEENWEKINY